jgi:hypothetical protein
MSTKQELQELNKKFDVLIQLMTQQQQSQQSTIEAVVVSEPIKKKRGRPRKNLLVAGHEAAEDTPVIEKKVRLTVSPCMNIAGVEYGGNVEVSEGIASQLRNMMQRWEAYERRTQQYIDHGVKDHGTM